MKMELVPWIFYDSLIMSECPISEKLSNGSTLNHSGSPHWQKQLYCICLQSWPMFYGLLPSSHVTIHGSMLTTINEKILADLELTLYIISKRVCVCICH